MVPKLCDFGLARQKTADTLTSHTSHTPAGTLHYMAPEIHIEEQTPHYPADIWSLGVTSIEWFTGKTAWSLYASTRDLRRVLREKKLSREPPDGLDNVPETMRHVLEKSFSYNPRERPKAEEILRDLRKIIGRSIRFYL